MAIKNIIDLNNQANTLLPDNNQQLISPVDVRTSIKDLNDSAINRLSDKTYLNLRTYDPARTYDPGEGCFYNGVIYEAQNSTTGAFNSSDWSARSSSSGTWGSIAGDISTQTDLQSLLAAKQNAITANAPLFFSSSVLNIQLANSSQNGYLSQSDWIAFHAKENSISFTSPLVRTGDTVSVQYVSDSQDGIVSAADWSVLTNGGFIDIAYSDALALMTGGTLQKGSFYKILTGTRINEKPGTSGSIIVQATDINTFASQGYLVARLPRYEEIGSTIIGMWTSLVSPTINNLYIYNGKVYQNLTGTNTSTSPDTDSTNWQLVDTAQPNYKTETDYIQYDFSNDWIYYREDARGNRYSFSRSNSSSVNGIDKFQWGNDAVYANTIDNGILDNINNISPSQLINLNKAGIYNSLATGVNRTYTFRDADGTVAFLSDINPVYPNYRIVAVVADPVQNGSNLSTALVEAQSLTPNGLPLSDTNRAAVYLYTGQYDIGNGFLNITQFVDIVGLGDPKEIVITSSNSTGTIQIANSNNYILKNLTVTNTATAGSITHNASQTDTGTWDNLIISAPNTQGTSFHGVYKNLLGTTDNVLNGSISGNVYHSKFLNNSCGYGAGTDVVSIGGTIENCTGGNNCFGYSINGSLTISGDIKECIANNNSFGYSTSGAVIISGDIKECVANNNSFGYSNLSDVTISGSIISCNALDSSIGNGNTVTISGLIQNCTANNNALGTSNISGNVIISGKILNTKGASNAYGRTEGNITISGTIQYCIATAGGCGFSFYGTVTISGFIDNVSGMTRGFGYGGGGVFISGTISNCVSNSSQAFGDTTSTGKLINCSRKVGYGTHLGTIDSCTFSENDATNPALTLGSGARVKYSTIYQAGAGDTISAASAITSSLYHNTMNKAENTNVTNNIATPYNVVDSNVMV